MGMPSRNSIKQFQPEALYHVYNRGVGKADIFRDEQDCRAFMRRLELMLLPAKHAESVQHIKEKDRIRIANYHDRIKMLAFCLMPNHFHLMLEQVDDQAITQFMHTLSTSYSMYFNHKYDRVGPLFQGRFKAAWVDSDEYSMHLSRYIHSNPVSLGQDIYTYAYSSLKYYFNQEKPVWLSVDPIMQYFSNTSEYKQFVDDLKDIKTAEKQYTLD